ncbi:hypothetical protein ACWC0C_19795 [Streptomyces sp. NPDC001709]
MLHTDTLRRLAQARVQEDWEHQRTAGICTWGPVNAASRGAVARRLVADALRRAGLETTRIDRYQPERGRKRGFLVTGDETAVRITMHPLPMKDDEQAAVARAVAYNGLEVIWRIDWDLVRERRSVIVCPGVFDWRGATTVPLEAKPIPVVLPEQCDHPRGYLSAVVGKSHVTLNRDTPHHSPTYVRLLAAWTLERSGEVLKYPGGLVTMTDPTRHAVWFYWPAPSYLANRECAQCGHFRSEHGSALYDDACARFQADRVAP